MKLWTAHAIFEVMGAIAAAPLMAPEGWVIEDDHFVPYVDGEEGTDGILAATAEFRWGQPGGRGSLAVYRVDIEPGDHANELTWTLLDVTDDAVVLMHRMIEVPSHREHEYSVAAYAVYRLGHPVADDIVAKVFEHLTTRKDMTAG